MTAESPGENSPQRTGLHLLSHSGSARLPAPHLLGRGLRGPALPPRLQSLKAPGLPLSLARMPAAPAEGQHRGSGPGPSFGREPRVLTRCLPRSSPGSDLKSWAQSPAQVTGASPHCTRPPTGGHCVQPLCAPPPHRTRAHICPPRAGTQHSRQSQPHTQDPGFMEGDVPLREINSGQFQHLLAASLLSCL